MDKNKIASELVRIARGLVAKEPALTVKVDRAYDLPTDKAEYRKYGIRALRWNSRGDVVTLKGSREKLIEFLEEFSPWMSISRYPELRSDERNRFDELKKSILSDTEKWGKPEEQALVRRLFQEHDFTADDLYDWDDRNLKYETSASEYISIRQRASVWTYKVEGYIKLRGKKYHAKATYKSDVNALGGWG
jgi:hypothetical protein